MPSSDSRVKHNNNKRDAELLHISKDLINKALHYKVETFAIEDLSIKSSDKDKGKNYNALCNNHWIRNAFINNLKKRCRLYNLRLLEVKPEYSSFIGNFVFRDLKLPDMILSSIEVGRRAYEFVVQYIKNIKEQKKNIVFLDEKLYKDRITKSLEEFGLEDLGSLKKLYDLTKSLDIKYRLSLDQFTELKFSRQRSLKYRAILSF